MYSKKFIKFVEGCWNLPINKVSQSKIDHSKTMYIDSEIANLRIKLNNETSNTKILLKPSVTKILQLNNLNFYIDRRKDHYRIKITQQYDDILYKRLQKQLKNYEGVSISKEFRCHSTYHFGRNYIIIRTNNKPSQTYEN